MLEKQANPVLFRAHDESMMHAKAGPKWVPVAARSDGRIGAAEDDLDVGAAPVAQDEVREHLRAGGEGSRSAICAPCFPPLSARHDA